MNALSNNPNVTVHEQQYENALENLTCITCGANEWHIFPLEGIFCNDCNCKLEISPTTGDRGFLATYNGNHCWEPDEVETAPSPDEQIPCGPTGHKATVKFLQTTTEDNTLTYKPYWVDLDTEENTNWTPAWERNNHTYEEDIWDMFNLNTEPNPQTNMNTEQKNKTTT